jgi:hypothetical protein
MKEACYPFVILPVTLDFHKGPDHANAVLIEFTKDYSFINITYYEPQGLKNDIHQEINIPYILEEIKKRMESEKHKVTIRWGCPASGIQKHDDIGLCYIFSRFWMYITLQVVKNCKGFYGFTGHLTQLAEKILNKMLNNDHEHIYDVIVSWMYRMISDFNPGNKKIMEYIEDELTTECKDDKIQCELDPEIWSLSECRKEFPFLNRSLRQYNKAISREENRIQTLMNLSISAAKQRLTHLQKQLRHLKKTQPMKPPSKFDNEAMAKYDNDNKKWLDQYNKITQQITAERAAEIADDEKQEIEMMMDPNILKEQRKSLENSQRKRMAHRQGIPDEFERMQAHYKMKEKNSRKDLEDRRHIEEKRLY